MAKNKHEDLSLGLDLSQIYFQLIKINESIRGQVLLALKSESYGKSKSHVQ